MYKEFINKLQKSGSYNGEPFEYNLLRLKEDYNNLINDSKKYSDLIDIFCEIENDIRELLVTRTKREDNFRGIHVTDIKNYDSILQYGLKIPNNNNIPNLGKGIYCIRNMNHKDYISKEEFGFDGHLHLSDWVLDLNGSYDWDEEEYAFKMDTTMICVVEIENYNGLYDECIYGEDHTGYIVLHEDVPPTKIKVNKMSLSEFEDNY